MSITNNKLLQRLKTTMEAEKIVGNTTMYQLLKAAVKHIEKLEKKIGKGC